MVKYVLMAGFVCYLTVSSMGCTYKQKPLPARPEDVSGWKDEAFDGVHSLAELVLDEGKSSESGQMGIEVVSISPYETRASPLDHPNPPDAVLRFYRVSDHQLIQDMTVSPGGRNLKEGTPISEPPFGINGIYVNAINTKERWVWFDLRR
jgi:hypothetical protein